MTFRRWCADFLTGVAARIYRPTADELLEQFTTLIHPDGSSLKLLGRTELP